MLEFLLDHHVSTELTDTDLWQPLHAAACWGHLEAVEILAQNGADISAVTRSGETPFDITEDPDIKDRLVELAEQRLRMAAEPGRGTGVRRGRSSAGSTRTHSIRRTSLRDKMKTTKKDVAEEGLIYMKSVTQSAPSPPVNEATAAVLDSTHNSIINNNNNNSSHHKEELLGAAGATTSFSATTSLPSSPSSGLTNSSGQNGGGGSTDVVDVADVQISLAGSFPPTPSLAPPIKSTPAVSAANLKPVQHVAPTIKARSPATTAAANGPSAAAAKTSSPPPVRPARLMDRRQSSVEESMVSGGTAGMPAAAASVWTSSPNVTNSGGSSSGGGEPINIHVSVTINPPLIGKKNSTLFFKLNFANIVMGAEIRRVPVPVP